MSNPYPEIPGFHIYPYPEDSDREFSITLTPEQVEAIKDSLEAFNNSHEDDDPNIMDPTGYLDSLIHRELNPTGNQPITYNLSFLATQFITTVLKESEAYWEEDYNAWSEGAVGDLLNTIKRTLSSIQQAYSDKSITNRG